MKQEKFLSMKKELLTIKQKGFSIIEIVLAVSIFGLIITAFLGTYLYGQESSVLAGNRSRAVFLASEGLEAVQNIRDEDFNNLADGTYGIATSTNEWAFLGSSDNTDIFTRQIDIETIDSDRKLITSTITWQQNLQRQGSVSIVGYLNNWAKVVAVPTTINIAANTKHASDNTGDNLAGITSDDATEDPDLLSSVSALDNVYSADKSDIMYIDSFDTSSIPGGSTITAAVLHLEYGAENGYNGTNSIRYDNGAGLTNTTITPTDITGWSGDLTFDLYAAGADTLAELTNLDIEFTNNDSGQADAIHFDYAWIEVTYN